jgi:hypothetical protein
MASQARSEISAARREEVQQNQPGDPAETNGNSHAIEAFRGVSAGATLQSPPSTIDEII